MVIYEKYLNRNRDSFKDLSDLQRNYKISYPEDFNFAYDVVDELGKTKPDKVALVWLSNTKEKKVFTFKDIMIWSNKAANFFKQIGIGGGIVHNLGIVPCGKFIK